MELLEYLIQVRGGREGRREADETAKGLEHVRRAAEEANVSSVTLGLGLNSVSGRMKLAGVAALFLGPALLSIGSSAGAAMIGGGMVAGGGLAALIVGMAGFVLIGKSFVSGTKNVSTALDAYHVSVAATGRYSDQSMKALQHLDAVVATSGGPKVLEAVRSWAKLKDTFHDLTGTARGALLGTYKDALTAAGKLMPTFAKETNRNSLSIRASLKSAFGTFSGAEAKGGISSLSATFREAQGPAMRGGVDLIVTLLRYLKASGPYVIEFSRGFASWAHQVRGSSSDVDRVNTRVAMFVGHLKSWGALLGALGHLTRTVFGQSQHEGQGLVDTMTLGVRRFDAWIASGDRGRKTFHESAVLLRDLGAAALPLLHSLGTLASAVMPATHDGLGGIAVVLQLAALRAGALADVIRFLGPLAKPMVIAFIAWKVAIIAVNAALAVLDVLFSLTPLGWAVLAIAAIAAAFYLAYVKIGWFHNAVDTVFSWIRSHWPLLLAILVGPFSLALFMIITHWDTIVRTVKGVPGRLARAGAGMWDFISDGFKSTLNWVIMKWNGFHIGMGGVKIKGHTVVPGFDLKTPDIPLLAEGGVSRMAGAAIVGEEGPEMVDLPAGAVVSPLGRGGDIVLKVDGREWARVSRRQVLAAQAGA